MKWTVLSDNRSEDPRLTTEHGLSIHLETEGLHLLLDTGASGLFVHNAEVLGIDLSGVDYVFLSHGHSDHAGGLGALLEINRKAKVIVSPESLQRKFFSQRGRLHSITTAWPALPPERLVTLTENKQIADRVHVIARIPQPHPMPEENRFLYVQTVQGELVRDDFRHEMALYVDGLLFTGCAHSGLENILSACPWPVHTVVGGFHLLEGQESDETLRALAERLSDRYPETQFWTSHCTGDSVFEVLHAVMGDRLRPFRCGTSVTV